MPLTTERRHSILRRLDLEYYKLHDAHYLNAPKPNTVPIGGGEWMDYFFRMEAIRGVVNALRCGKTVEEAIQDGKAVSEIAIALWNKKREYQVHRWTNCCHDYIERLVWRIQDGH